MVIPLFKVLMDHSVSDRLSPVIHSGYIGEGPVVKEFEAAVGRFIENSHVVCVNSGTMAITMALRLAGVTHGDRVITTPMTCLATNMAILSLGAMPVWADILPDGTINPESVKGLDGKAIVCVDWGGLPCMLDELRAFGLPVIEDACQSLGGYYNGRPVGNAADYVCFSFQAIKYLTTGDGGALTVPEEKLHEARLMRWFGLDRELSASMRCKQDPPLWGYKAHMNDIAASIGLANIALLPWAVSEAAMNASIYNEAFGRKPDLGRVSANWLYTIFVDDPDHFIAYMAKNGIECSQAHTRNDDKAVFAPFRRPLPGVDAFDARHVCIPVGWWVSKKDASRVANCCLKYKGIRLDE